jgi:hypothetical protein
MRHVLLAAIGAALAASPVPATAASSVTGEYVEARTAEVFTGGCTMNSEAETVGREALLAWHVREGHYLGTELAGLSVVAALAGDRNLGMREMGGERPSRVRSVLYVDARATPEQRAALQALVRQATNGLPTEFVQVLSAPIRFERSGDVLQVEAGDAALTVQTTVKHDPSCGAMQWFNPLGDLEKAAIGLTRSQVYWGDGLGKKWRQADKKSAFWGTFAIESPGQDTPGQP